MSEPYCENCADLRAQLAVLRARLTNTEFVNPDFVLRFLEPYRGQTKRIRLQDAEQKHFERLEK